MKTTLPAGRQSNILRRRSRFWRRPAGHGPRILGAALAASISLLPALGTAAETQFPVLWQTQLKGVPVRPAVGDLDGDGKPAMVVATLRALSPP